MAEKDAGDGSGRGAARPAAAAARPVRRTQEERSAATRRRLIQVAIQVLREQGYANLTISKVTQRAGVTNGAMQHHFGSRDDLVLALLDAVYPVLQIRFDAVAAEGLPARERISKVIDLLWAIYSRPEYLVVWDIAFGVRGDRKLWARVRSYQKEIAAHMRSEFARLFADMALGEADAERILSVAVASIRGIALQSMFGAEQVKPEAFDVIKDTASRQLAACAEAPL